MSGAVDKTGTGTRRIRSRMRGGAFALVFLLALGPRLCGAQSGAQEFQVKAAFLFHFAQLVDWPAQTGNSPFQAGNICILDDEPHGVEIQGVIEGKLIGNQTAHVHLLHQVQDAQNCGIVFLGRGEARRQDAILKSLRGRPILTVGETADFLSAGGMIAFHMEQERIRFDVNLPAADLGRLKISSRLLLLASHVIRGGADQTGGK